MVKENSVSLNLTEEQQAIIASGGNIKINAVAGSGKTTTIIQYAGSRPKGSKILYLAFNKSVRVEAKKRFSDLGLHNVQVETAHSLAYKHIVLQKQYSVSQNGYKTHEIAEKLGLKGMGEKHGEYILANHIGKFVAYFCNSSAEKVQDLDYREIVTDEAAKKFVAGCYRAIEHGARLFLNKMHKGEIAITHDFYLKLFQLSRPVLHYDYILFDEGQDASPAMLDIFLRQPAIKVIVGDTHQQIYAWRHAVNSLEKVDFTNYHLSTSFRFGQEIANLSREILSWKRHFQESGPVTINGKGKTPKPVTKATIARTNLGLLLQAINYITENRGVKHLYFEGNINSYTYADDGASLYDVLNLYNHQRDRIRDKLIGSMANMDELGDYIEKTEDMQLSMMVEIVREYENEIPSLIKQLKSKHVEDGDKDKAEMIFSTVHRSKGMEYDVVQLVDDFVTEAKLVKLNKEKKETEAVDTTRWNEEVNLLYVAVTRTKGILRIPETLLPGNFSPSPHVQVLKVKKEDSRYVPPEPFNASPAADRVKKRKGGAGREEQSYSYTQKRLNHKNAYERWTSEADEELKYMYDRGIQLKVIAEYFGRNRGAILSRLKKLGYGQSGE